MTHSTWHIVDGVSMHFARSGQPETCVHLLPNCGPADACIDLLHLTLSRSHL